MDRLTQALMDSFDVSKTVARIGAGVFLLAILVLIVAGVRLLS